MKALLHPTTFPNIATMAVMVRQNTVWEVSDNFQKQTYRNRYHICTDQGLHKLSIPIRHVGGADGRQEYKEVAIENGYAWQVQHWRTLQTAYRSSPYFEYYEDALRPLFEKKYVNLLDFNWATLHFLLDALQLPDFGTVERTSVFKKDFDQGRDFRVLVNAKKEVPFRFEEYHQVFKERHGFVPNASCLDLLFNEGPNALTYLQHLVLE